MIYGRPFLSRTMANTMHIFMRSVFALACALLVVSQAKANLFGADEPLPPLEVFVPSIERVDNEHISIRFSIEEAYYLYRDKLAFRPAGHLP